MKLTKLSAAWFPARTCRLMPAPSRLDAGTASQLIPGVRQTWSECEPVNPAHVGNGCRSRRCARSTRGVTEGVARVRAMTAAALPRSNGDGFAHQVRWV